jgi:hypothetical protein
MHCGAVDLSILKYGISISTFVPASVQALLAFSKVPPASTTIFAINPTGQSVNVINWLSPFARAFICIYSG